MGNQQPIQNIEYCVEIQDNKPNCTPIYRHPDSKDGLALMPKTGAKNLQRVILDSVPTHSGRNCLGSRVSPGGKYSHKSYQEVFELSKQMGSGIINMNLIPEQRQYEGIELKMIGIHAQNREEWVILDIANMLYGNTMVPLYDTLGPDTVEYVINHSEIATCICQAKTVKSMLECKNIPNLKNIVMVDEIPQDLDEIAKNKNINIIQWQEVLEAGKSNIKELPQIPENCCFTFSYTSGTTGLPKAAMVSHKNFISVLSSVDDLKPKLDHNDIHLSYLPLPHLFERLLIICYLYLGSSINFYGGDLLKLKEDLAEVRPTIFPSVPRIYNKFYSAIKTKFDQAQGLQKILLAQGLNSKLTNLQNDGSLTHKLWDAIVFNKTKAVLGGRCRLMLSGSAPISHDVINFLKVTMCCSFKEGYGMTESVTGGFLTYEDDITTGHVGGPTSTVEVRLVDVPDMNYTSKDQDEQGRPQPRGEIWIRGPTIFQGYYKDLQKTQETVDEEGWLHTGDIGLRLPSGAFRIIDRKKNIFKLAQGEYVAPEKVENIYVRAPEVEQVFLHGDSLENYCIGIIHPNQEAFMELAKKNNLSGEFEELCQNNVMINAMQEIVQKYGKEEKLYGFEQAKKVFLVPKSFQEYDCLTNTMKLQRHKAKMCFKEDIARIYKQLQ